jgi:hypothetical protein
MYLAPIAVAVLARHHAEQPQAAQQQGGLAGVLRNAAESMGGSGNAASAPSGGAIGSVLGHLFG